METSTRAVPTAAQIKAERATYLGEPAHVARRAEPHARAPARDGPGRPDIQRATRASEAAARPPGAARPATAGGRCAVHVPDGRTARRQRQGSARLRAGTGPGQG